MDIDLWLLIVTCGFNEAWILRDKLVNQIGEKVDTVFVLGLLFIDLVEKLLVLQFYFFELILGLLLLHLIVHNSLLQELRQVRFTEVFWFFNYGVLLEILRVTCGGSHFCDLIFDSLYLAFVLLDDSVTEVRTFCQLIFNFFVLFEFKL